MRYYTTAELSEHISETKEGYLLCRDVPIARSGSLMYRGGEILTADGMPAVEPLNNRVIITRTADDIFQPETLASFEGKPVVLSHPIDENGRPIFIGPDNWQNYSVGTSQNVRPGACADGTPAIIADMLITDREAIYAVKNGLRQVSAAYDADYTQDAPGYGHPENIIGNHIALVPSGRCGAECSILDHETNKEKKPMTFKEKFLGLVARVFDEAAAEEKPAAGEGAALDADGKPIEGAKVEPPAGDALPASEGAPAAAADAADMSGIISDLQCQLAGCMSAVNEYKARIETLEAAIAALTAAPAATTDAAPTIDAETIARAEILAPGLEVSADIMPAALKAAYATTDGKAIIDTLSGGKAPAFDSVELFTAAAELLKEKRTTAFAGTKTAPAADAKTADSYATFQQKAAEMFPIPKFN